MSSNIGFKISLTNAAQKALDQAALSRILSQVLQEAAEQARANAPVLTGELRSSIGSRVNGLKGELFAGAPHAMPVEFGHVTKSGSITSGRPYLRPSAEDAHKKLGPEIKKHVDAALRNSKGR